MNITQVLRIVTALVALVAAFMVLPLIVAIIYGETEVYHSFLIPIAGIAICSTLYLTIVRPTARALSTRDGFLMVTLSWLAASLVGALPFWISQTIPHYVDCFFETMSGFTTTGASILTDIETLPRSMLFWRSLTHWLGGMGIIVLAVAIFPLLGIGGQHLFKAETPGPIVDKITPKITETAKILWLIYLSLTVAEALLLLIGGMNLFDALTHTFGTLATGGFSPRNASVGHYDSPFIHVVITCFMLMAGINFILYYRVVSGKPRAMLQDAELRNYLLIFVVSTLLVAIIINRTGVYQSFGETLRYSGFQTASILTTTGYVTADFDAWPFAARAVLLTLMFVGGCAGSTGGGIKVVRIALLLKQAVGEMKYLLHPQGVFVGRLGTTGVVNQKIIYTVAGFVTLYMIILSITTLVVAGTGVDLLTAISTALVTLGNIGPGFGAIGPTENYAFYPTYVKWFLGFIMMLGRLELFTVLIIFTPRFWRL